MLELLDHPEIQVGVIPLIVALIVGFALVRSRYAWLAIVAGYATMIVLAGELSFSPLTATRKVMLVGFVAALVGVAVDSLPRPPKHLNAVLAIIAGGLSPWVFVSVLRQSEGLSGVASGAGIAAFVLLLVAAVLWKRGDGLRTGATGFGLGVATGVAGVLSASIGYLMGGAALAASSGALLLIQVVAARTLAPGFTGALPISVLAALFAVATLLLAQLPWYALPLLLLVPLATSLPIPERATRPARAAILCGYTLAAAVLPILAAWYAARGSLTS